MSALPYCITADGEIKANLDEAGRLLEKGFTLVKLLPLTKRPEGDNWNRRRANEIDPLATGYGVPLVTNGLCSIDPDHVEMARAGMQAWGFDLDAIMAAGVRTRSTRPHSGGRAAFSADSENMIRWLSFTVFDDVGNSITVLELRAKSENLQDCVPGVIYRDKSGEIHTQEYANGKTLDEAPPLPDDLVKLWRLMSLDDDSLREYTRVFVEAIARAGFKVHGVRPQYRPPMGNGEKLAFPSSCRGQFNRDHKVPDILDRHFYEWHSREKRYSHPGATGAPGIREIPGKDGLWRSDHAGDPLHGTFDAWAAYVQLDHGGDVAAAEAAYRQQSAGGAETETDQQQQETDPPESLPEKNPHPLTRIIELRDAPIPPAWVLPHFIAEGLVVIAGAHGVGKTTALLPLAMAAAGLHEEDYALAPREWRHVVYITEDTNQVERIIAGYAPTIGQTPTSVSSRVHVVAAARLHPDVVFLAGQWYADQFTRTVKTSAGGEVTLKPLVVFDTKAAVFQMDNEIDNAEISKMIAGIKQRFAGLPAWVVGHVAKSDLSRDVAKSGMPTFRGGTAFEADANQVMYLVRERDDSRWLVRGKTRFEARWEELQVKGHASKTLALNAFGEPEELVLRWAIATPQGKTRQQRVEEAEHSAAAKAREAKTAECLDIINRAWEQGDPLNRTGLAAEMGGNGSATKRLIREILDSAWAVEIPVPQPLRTNNTRSKFIVALTDSEREQYLHDGTLPEAKLHIPESWRKPDPEQDEQGAQNDPNPSVPAENG